VTYAILIKQHDDSYVRAFGSYRNRAKAQELAEAINAEIEEIEEQQFDAWQARTDKDPDEMMPTGFGRASVHVLHKPNRRRMLAFALGNLDS